MSPNYHENVHNIFQCFLYLKPKVEKKTPISLWEHASWVRFSTRKILHIGMYMLTCILVCTNMSLCSWVIFARPPLTTGFPSLLGFIGLPCPMGHSFTISSLESSSSDFLTSSPWRIAIEVLTSIVFLMISSFPSLWVIS